MVKSKKDRWIEKERKRLLDQHYGNLKVIEHKRDVQYQTNPLNRRLIVISNVIINNQTLGVISIYNGEKSLIYGLIFIICIYMLD